MDTAMFRAMINAVRKIPFGKVASYGQVARAAGYPASARQVVWALRSPLAKGAPWHRVVGAGGRILLPGEAGLEQRFRLVAEGVTLAGQRVRIEDHAYQFRQPKKRRARINT